MKQISITWLFIIGAVAMAQGQNHAEEFEALINQYVQRCENGPPTIMPFANRKGYLVETSDSTWVDYPQGRVYKMRQEDLGKEQAYQFNIGYHVSDSLYLVHSGGGVVYLHDGRALQRVDESFYHHNQYNAASFAYQGDLFLVALILIVINELKFEKRIVIRLKGGTILFRSRNIRVFSPEEKELLMQLATSEALSFSDLEDIVSFPKDSQSVRVKKRDRHLRVLNEKIATIFNHDSANRPDYFTVQNSSDDKRSRLLGLNSEYFKIM